MIEEFAQGARQANATCLLSINAICGKKTKKKRLKPFHIIHYHSCIVAIMLAPICVVVQVNFTCRSDSISIHTNLIGNQEEQ